MGRTPGVPNWTPEEEERLRLRVDEKLIKDLAPEFGRSVAAIHSKVYNMGLADRRRKGRSDPGAPLKSWRLRSRGMRPGSWTREDEELLRRLAPKMLQKNLAVIFRRSVPAISAKISELGLSDPARRGRRDPNLSPASARPAVIVPTVKFVNPIRRLSNGEGITVRIERMMQLAGKIRKAA